MLFNHSLTIYITSKNYKVQISLQTFSETNFEKYGTLKSFIKKSPKHLVYENHSQKLHLVSSTD